jgi:hypothetical protein
VLRGFALLRPAVPLGQRLANHLRLTGDDVEVGLGGRIRLLAALLPVAQRADRDVIARGYGFAVCCKNVRPASVVAGPLAALG